MEKRLKNYLASIDRLLEDLASDRASAPHNLSGDDGTEHNLLAEHLAQISFFQHERLIHLIVTCLFAILSFAVFLSLLFLFQIGLAVLFCMLLVLLVPYIRHYYILENGVQRMYAQYDRMRELLGLYSAFHR